MSHYVGVDVGKYNQRHGPFNGQASTKSQSKHLLLHELSYDILLRANQLRIYPILHGSQDSARKGPSEASNGTGSARACIMNDEGDIVGLASETIKLWQPQPGHYEQSTTDIWKALCSCIRQAVSQGSIDPAAIKGIGFDATCSLAVLTHDTDEPVSVTGPAFDNSDHSDRNIVLWLDHRPVEETRLINATKHHLLQYVGGQMNTEMEVPKVLWLKNNMSQDLFDQCKFYDLTDALTHLATGGETRSLCSVACKQGYVPVGVDGSVKGWQEDFLQCIGLEALCQDSFKRTGGVDRNGHYMTAGELVGGLSEKAATDMGLPAGIAVGSGVIDAYAGWIGSVGAKVDLQGSSLAEGNIEKAFTRLAAVAGTSTCYLAMSKNSVFVNGIWGPYRDVIIPDCWMAEGGQSATGELLKHVIETHPAYAEASSSAKEKGVSIYDFLNGTLQETAEKQERPTVSYLGRHFFFYGDFFGNRSPIALPGMTGAVVGLTSDRSVASLALHYYGAMEFIALQTRQIVETMNRSGHVIDSIFMSGSLCQNEILMDLMATSCNLPVVIPQYVNAAVVHGAAMLGARAASADGSGHIEPLWNIMSRMSKPGRAVLPSKDKGQHKLLDAKYKVFLELCESQQRYRKEVDAAIEGWTSCPQADL